MTTALLQRLAPPIVWDPPSLLYQTLSQPVKTLVRLLDLVFNLLRSPPEPGTPPIKVVCISDTHCIKAANIPDGDLLIHAGDLANLGSPAEIQRQLDWLDSLPHEHKVVIAGNHDRYLDPRSRRTLSSQDRQARLNWKSLKYLQHNAVNLKFSNGRQLKVYGAPQTPADKKDDFAFRYPRGSDAWSNTIPKDLDVLVTHTPPKFHLDLPVTMGCEHLLAEVWKVQPTLHIFGHVHAGKTDFFGRLKGGREVVRWDECRACLERALSRPDGFMRGLIDPRGWFDVAIMLFHGTASVLWTRVWGGEGARSTTVVNAALMFNSTGHLGNPPQVIAV